MATNKYKTQEAAFLSLFRYPISAQDWDTLSKDETILSYAVKLDSDDAIRGFIKVPGFDVNAIRKDGTLLHWAAFDGSLKVVKALLQVPGINVNLPDPIGDTPLHKAAMHYQAEVIKVLLQDRRVDPNLPNKSGYTPLSFVCAEAGLKKKEEGIQNRASEVVKAFLEEPRVEVNSMGTGFYTPLHLALMQANLKFARVLARSDRVDKNIQDRQNGNTALHLAAMLRTQEVPDPVTENDKILTIQHLVNRTDKSIQNKAGQTAYEVFADINEHSDLDLKMTRISMQP